MVNSLTRGVNTLYIFTATGLHLFGNAKGVIYGGDATNTPISLVFPKGSNPPLAAYTRLGSGSIVLINDPDMFTNVNIDPTKYRNDNVKFAVNIMDWLSTPFQDQLTDQEVDNIMKSLKTQVTDDNRTIVSLQAQTDSLNQQITTLSSEKEGLTSELAKYRSDKVMGLPWLTYSSLAMFVLAGAFLLTCVVVMKKGRKKPEKKEGQGGELGYEFDEKTDEENAAEGDEEVKTAGKIKEEDVEERLRELQKTSK